MIADSVTSLGAMPVNVDQNGIDVAYSCTQKGMSAPPGLSPITVSPRALERLRGRKTPIDTWYLDLKLLDEYFEGPRRYHHTAPITLFYALHEGLSIIREEGIANRQARHKRAHERLIAGLSGSARNDGSGRRAPHLESEYAEASGRRLGYATIRNHLMENYGSKCSAASVRSPARFSESASWGRLRPIRPSTIS